MTTTESLPAQSFSLDQLMVEIEQSQEVLRRPDSLALPANIYKDEILSARYEAEIFMVSELHQPSGAFKTVAAEVLAASLTHEQKAKGTAAATAGNWGSAWAQIMARMGVRTGIWMPETTPSQKLERMQKYAGKNVTLNIAGADFDEAKKLALEFCDSNGAFFAPPYDHTKVIAGNGTIGLETLAVLPRLDYFVTAIGGGGAAAGIGTALKSQNPNIKVVGVESENAASMQAAQNSDGPVELGDEFDTYVDGAAVKQAGELTYRICNQVVDEYLVVSNQSLRRMVTELWDREQSLPVELASGLPAASLDQLQHQIRGKQVALFLSGGNLSRERFEQEVRL